MGTRAAFRGSCSCRQRLVPRACSKGQPSPLGSCLGSTTRCRSPSARPGYLRTPRSPQAPAPGDCLEQGFNDASRQSPPFHLSTFQLHLRLPFPCHYLHGCLWISFPYSWCFNDPVISLCSAIRCGIFFFFLQISICIGSFVAFEQRKGRLCRREAGLIKLQRSAGTTTKQDHGRWGGSSSGLPFSQDGQATLRGSSCRCWGGFKSCKHMQAPRTHACTRMAQNLHQDPCRGVQTTT